MSKLFTLICLLLCSYTLQAQKIRFTDTTNEWTTHAQAPWDWQGRVGNIKYTGHDTVNGKRYQIMSGRIMMVREDTTVGKVYCIKGIDTVERLLYDYNLAVNDTLGYWDGCPLVLQRIDTIMINGYAHKVQRFNASTVIKGIGALADNFEVVCPFPDRWTNVVCFKNNARVITAASPDGGYFLSPHTCLLSVADALIQSTTLSPNPIDETSTLRFKTPVTGTLIITNTMGQIIAQVELQQQTIVPIGKHVKLPGIYYYRIAGSNGIASGKFTKT